ncbi:ribosomal-processing cysteine protease Prp [Schleiferilactobacillus shenzhenensis]|nr:ribosomal-processing cysteine protease Prp [Schleiferilactobacillus shenzhenensis]
MIKADFYRDPDGNITRFTITGHAGSGPYGYDIVCAAVSAVAIGTVNGIEGLAGIMPAVQTDDEEGGLLTATLPAVMVQEKLTIAQILLENLLLELQSIRAEYGQFLQVKTNQDTQPSPVA